MSARALSSALPILLTLGDVSCASSDREAPTGAAPAAVVGDDGPETDAENDIVTFELASQPMSPPKVEEDPQQPAVADPAKGTPEVTVVATLVGLPDKFPPHCGRAYFSIFAEYEVVRVVSGALSASRFFAVHGCPEMLRSSLKSFDIGDVHRLELSTDPKVWRGMSLPPPPRPPFYGVRRVQKE